ncbi:MAG: hypothetical protein ABGZ24_01500, partial [Fuerstiella sp.]
QDRLAPLQAWLFPRRLYLQLEDQAITGMILNGSRIVWLERLELPEGVCTDGETLQTGAQGAGNQVVRRKTCKWRERSCVYWRQRVADERSIATFCACGMQANTTTHRA